MVEEAKSCGIVSCDLELLDGTPLCFNLVTFLGASTPFRGLTLSGARLDSTMKSRLLSWALLACIATGALALSGCSTISSRIDANRAAFDQLPPEQRALVSQGSIQGGMSQEAVYIAWGQPQGKAVGMVRGVPTETWVYTQLTAAYGPYGYGPDLALVGDMAGGDMQVALDFTGAMDGFVTTGLSSIPTGTHTITHLRERSAIR